MPSDRRPSSLGSALRPFLVGALLSSALVGCDSGDGEAVRPHVLLITLDTVRADYLSCYGATTGDTPAIDQIAAEGVLFERAMSASGLTPSSHATILTGKFQDRHGLRVLSAASGFQLAPSQATLATAFQEAGYITGAVHSAFPVSGYFGFSNGFDEFQSFETTLKPNPEGTKTGWDVASFQRRSDETTDRALKWFTETVEQDVAPVFLWIHYWDPHDPVVTPPADDVRLFDPGSGRNLTDQERLYAAEVRYQDRNMGRLFGELRARGIMDKTLIAITADHGQGLSDGVELHGWGMHRALYREQLHVPMIFRGPGVPSGVRAADQVRTADVAPTLVQLAGLEPGTLDHDLDGVSVQDRFDGQVHGPLTAYGEQINGYDDNAGMRKKRPEAAFLHMISDGEWKVIYRPHMPERSELFHIAADELEAENVRDENPSEYLRLMALLAERAPWVLEPFPRVDLNGPDAAASEAMGGLGYIGTTQGQGTWRWRCPEHTDHVADERGRHNDSCGRILVPFGEWVEPK